MSVHPTRPVDLEAALAARLAQAPAGPLWVGYSGGLDSTVLLHLLARLPEARARGLGAIHVEHGLHPAAPDWAALCARRCAALGLPLLSETVAVEGIAEWGLEGAARRARLAAFARRLPTGAVLTLAHHRDDQAETLLLRLLHGAGSEGLAGMRERRTFATGWLWRPLLDTDRDTLRTWAERQGLDWIEDPANLDRRHARAVLRSDVVPALRARWPDATARVAAAATRLRAESDALQQQALQALAAASGVDPATLSVSALAALSPALLRRVLGAWLDLLGLPRPPPGLWSRIGPEVVSARANAVPRLAWRGAELRRYRDLLYARRPQPAPAQDWTLRWDGTAALVLPQGFGRIAFDPAPADPQTLTIRPRRGGERLRQPGAHRALRTLLQDLGVPPWVRAGLPLLCDARDVVLAAGDLAFDPDFDAWLRGRGMRVHWQPAD